MAFRYVDGGCSDIELNLLLAESLFESHCKVNYPPSWCTSMVTHDFFSQDEEAAVGAYSSAIDRTHIPNLQYHPCCYVGCKPNQRASKLDRILTIGDFDRGESAQTVARVSMMLPLLRL